MYGEEMDRESNQASGIVDEGREAGGRESDGLREGAQALKRRYRKKGASGPDAAQTGKVKRKYTRRSPVRVSVGGKTYRGTAVAREGKFLVLATARGYVYFNTDLIIQPIEVVGTLTKPTPIPITMPVSNMAGGVAEFKQRRNMAIEAAMAMPRFEEDQ